jgi:hypothetical protein
MTGDAPELAELMRAAHRARVEAGLLLDLMERRVLPARPRDENWLEEVVDTATRARRLMGLGVNIQGVEVVLHMRRRMVSLRSEMDELRREMRRLQREHEREMARLLRELAHDLPPDRRRQTAGGRTTNVTEDDG